MSSDSILREKVRRMIETGKLPNRSPDHVWGGPGTGARCAVCEAFIARTETELELEFAGGDATKPRNVFVHVGCFSMLEKQWRGMNGAKVGEPSVADRHSLRSSGSGTNS